MPMAEETRAPTIARGRAVKKRNALTAIGFGGLLALVAQVLFPSKPLGASVGFLVGLFYANAFEYFFHRFGLHGSDFLALQHPVHHATWGEPDEALYVNFAKTRWAVVALFAVNAVPFFIAESIFRLGALTGVLMGFVVYFLAFEEIHWRIHMGGWLPSWLHFARRHHLTHHAEAHERFNVFLPLCDWLFGSLRSRTS